MQVEEMSDYTFRHRSPSIASSQPRRSSVSSFASDHSMSMERRMHRRSSLSLTLSWSAISLTELTDTPPTYEMTMTTDAGPDVSVYNNPVFGDDDLPPPPAYNELTIIQSPELPPPTYDEVSLSILFFYIVLLFEFRLDSRMLPKVVAD